MTTKTITDNTARINALVDIQFEMKRLLREASKLVEGTYEENRAKSYWIAHIRCALDDDHGYMSRQVTMQNTIEALEREGQQEEEGDE